VNGTLNGTVNDSGSGVGASEAVQAGVSVGGAAAARSTAPIEIGVATADGSSTFGATLGLNVTFGDTRAQAKAVIDDINRHGGLLGRRIVPVFHDVDLQQANTDPAGAQQAACADFTEDHHVAAVISAVATLNYPNFQKCLAKHHVAEFITDAARHYRSQFEQYQVFAPGVVSAERMIPMLVPRVRAQGYFGGWDTIGGQPGSAPIKVGLLYTTSDAPLVQLYRTALARNGLKLADSFELSDDINTYTSQIPNAVLRFRNNGITHVFTNGNIFFFGPAAEQQHYRPRYGVSIWDSLPLSVQTVPSAQFAGALGIGYVPMAEVDAAKDPGDVSPAQAQCRRVMQQAGQDTSSRPAFWIMGFFCDAFYLLQAAADSGRSVTPTGLQRGMDAVGTTRPSAITFRAHYGPGLHDGASAVRDLAYDSACSCFSYPRKADFPL
jgi:ABC-type branched-subunit amino acid transport system substrate-binding protein